MTKRDNILMKIQRLLALANGDANEHEAASAAAKAQKLMLEYDLCIADLDDISVADTDIKEEVVHETGRLANWRLDLLIGVARAFNCRTLISSGYRLRSLRLVGTQADVSVARTTYDYLTGAVDRLAKANVKGMGRSFITSYKLGMVGTIIHRLKEQARENAAEVEKTATSAGTELVLVKNAALKEHMSQYTGTYRAPQSGVNSSGYNQGRHDGGGVSLNSQIGGKSNNRLH